MNKDYEADDFDFDYSDDSNIGLLVYMEMNVPPVDNCYGIECHFRISFVICFWCVFIQRKMVLTIIILLFSVFDSTNFIYLSN
jgi:hypothetical protein